MHQLYANIHSKRRAYQDYIKTCIIFLCGRDGFKLLNLKYSQKSPNPILIFCVNNREKLFLHPILK